MSRGGFVFGRDIKNMGDEFSEENYWQDVYTPCLQHFEESQLVAVSYLTG